LRHFHGLGKRIVTAERSPETVRRTDMSVMHRRLGVGAAIATAALIHFGSQAIAAEEGPYRVITNWVQLPAETPIGEVTGMAPDDAKGTVYVFQRQVAPAPDRPGSKLPPILLFDAKSGKLLKSFADGMFPFAHGLYLDKQGFLWATDIGPREKGI